MELGDGFLLSISSDAPRSAVPVACVTMPTTARPLRFLGLGSTVIWKSTD